MNKLKIAVLFGGESSECQISINSTLNVINNIDRSKFIPYLVFVGEKDWFVLLDKNQFPNYPDNLTDADIIASLSPFDNKANSLAKELSLTDKGSYIAHKVDLTNFSICDGDVTFDKALIMIHGTPGENGLLQGYLEMKKISHASCSSYVSAITFDKHSCKRFLDFAGVKMADDIFIRKEVGYSKREIIRQVGLPMFVKPTVGGSSFGVTKVKSEDQLEQALQNAFKECSMVLAEEAISGREITCAVYKLDDEIVKLPLIEIVTKREFFDYEAKYLGESEEICPAPISKSLTARVQNTSEKIYKYMGCSGIVRIDYIVDKEENIYFLEVNTVPGMTKMSLVPKMLRVAGIELKDLLTNFIEKC